MMSASRMWWRRPILGIGVMSMPLLLAFSEVALSQGGGVVPRWPRTETRLNSACDPDGVACADCNSTGATFGCTSQIPTTFSSGTCKDQPGGSGCVRSTFDCGPQYQCATGDPTGLQPCNQGTICKNN